MEQLDWTTQISTTVAGEVRRYRLQRGLSAQQLSDRCAELGMLIPRTVVSNIENGRRGNITVAEILILGRALDVPPGVLVFPVGYAEQVEPTPGESTHPMRAIQWFSGESPFPTSNLSVYSWMRTAIFFVRKVEEGKAQTREAMRRATDLSRLASASPPGPLRKVYEEAASQEMEAYQRGEHEVDGWLTMLKEGLKEFDLGPLPYADAGEPGGTITIQMAPDILSSLLSKIVGEEGNKDAPTEKP